MSEENTSRTGSSAAESMRMSYDHVRDAAKHTYDQVRGQATEYYQQGKAKASEYQQQVESHVRENPMRSVLIAAGVGLLVGMLVRRA